MSDEMKPKGNSAVIALLIILIIINVFFIVSNARQHVSLKSAIMAFVSGENPISLTSRAFQPLWGNPGYAVCIRDVSSKLNGIVVSGELLNSTSVTNEDQEVEFVFKQNNKIIGSQDFEIKRINSGNAAKFKVFIQNIPQDIEDCYMKIGKSMMLYQKQY